MRSTKKAIDAVHIAQAIETDRRSKIEQLNAALEGHPRITVTLTLLEMEGSPAFIELSRRFVANEPTETRTLDVLFEQLRSPEAILPGKKKATGGQLHVELQLLRDALERHAPRPTP